MKRYIQIGANNCIDVFRQLPEKDDSIIFVEPFEQFNDEIRAAYAGYKNLTIINKVVDSQKGSVRFYWHSGDAKLRTASIHLHHVLKHQNKGQYPGGKILSREIEAITIDELLVDIPIVEMLFMDTEGNDENIIRSIDFEKHTIRNLVFEHLHISRDNTTNLYQYLTDKGYHIQRGFLEDTGITLARSDYDDLSSQPL